MPARKSLKIAFPILLVFVSLNGWSKQNDSFRPLAIPLVIHDPYFSIWSMTDCLGEDWTRHWTGRAQALMAMVRIDDEAYRLMGREPPRVPAMNQTGFQVLAFGLQEQPVLEKSGDDLRIDWGYFYLAVPRQEGLAARLCGYQESREGFIQTGQLPPSDDLRFPRPVEDRYPVAAAALDFGTVGEKSVSRFLLPAYDDQFSIEYFYRKTRPFWRSKDWGASDLLEAAARDYAGLTQRCQKFDEELVADMLKAGGEKYARLATLAYRQSLAAHKLAVDIDGTPLFFPKENFSNGCIPTVDVIYPESPMYLLFNTQLLRALLVPVLDYAQSPKWKFPFAPHDLGTYPKANGQVYGGGAKSEEDQMPVEESGNMLLMIAALTKVENKADFASFLNPVYDFLNNTPDRVPLTDWYWAHDGKQVGFQARPVVGGVFVKMMADPVLLQKWSR